jgi:5-methylcytosine-specific restriction endonuclease McrA
VAVSVSHFPRGYPPAALPILRDADSRAVKKACPLGHIYDRAQGRCPRCEPARLREVRASPYQQILRGPRWKRARAAVQARDGGRCQLEEQGECYGRLEVHHLVPVRSGGDPYDLGNLVVVCRGHHEAIEKRHREERRRARR